MQEYSQKLEAKEITDKISSFVELNKKMTVYILAPATIMEK